MSQVALFHESITDAMREVILALGGLKSVASRMRPEMPADHAGRWLADCLSAERREREFIEAAKSMQAMAERLTRLDLKVA